MRRGNIMDLKSKRHEICLELLKEVDEICNKGNIRYYLIGDMALAAYRDNDSITNPSVAIHAKDVKKFIKIVNENLKEGRGFEHPFVNADLPAFYLRYCNLNTLDCTRGEYNKYIYNCLHVNIRIISGMVKGGTKNKIKNKLAAFYRTSNKISTSGKSVKYKVLHKAFRTVRNILGFRRTAKWAFNAFLDVSSDKSENVKIEKKTFDRALFKEPSEVYIDDFRFNLPTDVEGYLESVYKNWTENKIKDDESSAVRVISTTESWESFENRLKECNFEQYYAELKKYKRENIKFSIYNRKVNGYYALLQRTNDRFLLYTQFMPLKDTIIKLYDQNNYDELREVLRPFINALEKNYKKNLGLCFDKEIFDITMKLYQADGKSKKAEALRKLVPNEHWAPIRVKNYKGEYIN